MSNEFIERVSVDVGYGYVKTLSSDGKEVIFPSVVGSGRERGLANFLEEPKAEVDLSEMHINIDGRHYYVGEMALKNSLDGTRVFEKERYNHEYSQILMNVAIQLVTKPETKEVVLFTGLPLGYYQDQHKEFKEKLLEESPVIEWVSEGVKRKVTIRDVMVFPQGMSALWSTFMNHEGKVIHKDLLKEGNQIGIIDIGYRTTDVCVVEMKEQGAFRILFPFSETIDQGVVNLHENIKVAYQNRTGGTDLSENKINRILKEKSIRYKGKDVDLSNEVEDSFNNITNSINDRLNKLWKEESDTFDYIFVVGGGGSLFMDYLQKNFDNRLMSIVSSQFANTIGYYRMGKIMSNSIPVKKIANY